MAQTQRRPTHDRDVWRSASFRAPRLRSARRLHLGRHLLEREIAQREARQDPPSAHGRSRKVPGAQRSRAALRNKPAGARTDPCASHAVPLQLERQTAAIHRQIVEAQTDVDRALYHRETAHNDQRIERLKHEERELEARIRIRQLEAELAGLINPSLGSAPPNSDTPEAFRKHWATERRSAATARRRKPVSPRFMQAPRRAPAAHPDEIEEVDALASAAQGAESEVRRRAASGLR